MCRCVSGYDFLPLLLFSACALRGGCAASRLPAQRPVASARRDDTRRAVDSFPFRAPSAARAPTGGACLRSRSPVPSRPGRVAEGARSFHVDQVRDDLDDGEGAREGLDLLALARRQWAAGRGSSPGKAERKESDAPRPMKELVRSEKRSDADASMRTATAGVSCSSAQLRAAARQKVRRDGESPSAPQVELHARVELEAPTARSLPIASVRTSPSPAAGAACRPTVGAADEDFVRRRRVDAQRGRVRGVRARRPRLLAATKSASAIASPDGVLRCGSRPSAPCRAGRASWGRARAAAPRRSRAVAHARTPPPPRESRPTTAAPRTRPRRRRRRRRWCRRRCRRWRCCRRHGRRRPRLPRAPPPQGPRTPPPSPQDHAPCPRARGARLTRMWCITPSAASCGDRSPTPPAPRQTRRCRRRRRRRRRRRCLRVRVRVHPLLQRRIHRRRRVQRRPPAGAAVGGACPTWRRASRTPREAARLGPARRGGSGGGGAEAGPCLERPPLGRRASHDFTAAAAASIRLLRSLISMSSTSRCRREWRR